MVLCQAWQMRRVERVLLAVVMMHGVVGHCNQTVAWAASTLVLLGQVYQ